MIAVTVQFISDNVISRRATKWIRTLGSHGPIHRAIRWSKNILFLVGFPTTAAAKGIADDMCSLSYIKEFSYDIGRCFLPVSNPVAQPSN